ncbi:MAG: lactoylglutathione lyase [Alteromonadaceae bacterium]|jgi:lactoylglutathione lyase
MKLDHMVISLSDIESQINFYQTLLPLVGFSQKNSRVFEHVDGFAIEFKQAEEVEHGYHRYGPGLNHLGFMAADLAEIEQVAQTMKNAGFAVADIQSFSKAKALFLKDADGMRIEVACKL